MVKSTAVSKVLAAVLGILFAQSVGAADFEWSGTYRIEGNHIKNPRLSGTRELDYGLHHLSLRPKIVAGDGITIYGQFDILTNPIYPNSQLGQTMGGGVSSDIGVPGTTIDHSRGLSANKAADVFRISQLYLSWVHEYGALLAGRAPLQFGLGMSYNSGKGLFDHWFDTRDLVGYKLLMGNLSLLPMYGKVTEREIGRAEDINDFMIQVQYENTDTDLEMGLFYRVRKSGGDGSDAAVGEDDDLDKDLIGGDAATRSAIDMNELSLYVLKDTDDFRFGVEGSFLNGKIGATTAGGGSKVTVNGFGIAGEFEWRPQGSKWQLGTKAGFASGDDPETDNRFEGYVFDRNYEVGMLLFNRPLGQNDVLRTQVYGGSNRYIADPVTGTSALTDKPDVESLSNAMYVAPHLNYKWNDKFTLHGVAATGWLSVDPLATGDVGKALGYELDLGLSFSPRKGIMWRNDFGMLFPGSAFDFNGDDPSFAYGFTSRAAISF
jgi:hypothetical protein